MDADTNSNRSPLTWLHLAHSNPRLWQRHSKSMVTRLRLQILWAALVVLKTLQALASTYHLEQATTQMGQLLQWMEEPHGALLNGENRFKVTIYPFYQQIHVIELYRYMLLSFFWVGVGDGSLAQFKIYKKGNVLCTLERET